MRPLPAGADRAALLEQFDTTGTAFAPDPAARVSGHGLSLAAPEAFGRHIATEIDRWRKVVREAGIRVQ